MRRERAHGTAGGGRRGDESKANGPSSDGAPPAHEQGEEPPASRSKGRVSLVQVAALAGVSGQTVSRVVTGSARVDPTTRARVERAMAELGYRPNRAARALRTGRTDVIGVVVTTLATVGNSRMLQAVVEKAAERGYGVTVATLARPGGVAGAFDRLRDQGVDGAIVLNEASALAHGAIPADVPAAVVDAPPGAAAVATISSSHRAGARAAVDHLLGLGHRRIAHLAGPGGSFAAAEREAGWRDALAADVPASDHGVLVRGDWSAESGYAAADRIAASGASAVFSANDQMALGLIRALNDSGVDVPAGVSVVGFDDVPDAANYRPPLTTVRQDFARLAEHAVDALLAAIDAPAAPPVRASVPVPLVVRESTAPLGGPPEA